MDVIDLVKIKCCAQDIAAGASAAYWSEASREFLIEQIKEEFEELRALVEELDK